MTIAELVAELKIVIDRASVAKTDRALSGYGKKIESFAKKANAALGRGLNVVGAAGLGAFVVAAKDVLKFDEALTTLQISADGVMGSAIGMRKQFLALSQATGVAKEDLVAGAQAYVAATGDGKGAISMVNTFARVSKAAATPMDDVARAGAAMAEQFGLMPDQMESAFSILIAGGKAGKIELVDMARHTSKLGAAFKQFGGSQGLDGAAGLGAMFQIVAKDAGDAEAAAVNLENFMNVVQRRRFELAAMGVKVEEGKTGSGKYKDVFTILKLLDAAQKKNAKGFQEAFGNDAQAGAGFRALRQRIPLLDELTRKTRDSQAVAHDLEIRNASAAERASKAWNTFKVRVAEAFTPERIEGFVRAIERAAGVVGRIIEAVGGVDNALTILIATWVVLKGLQLTSFLVTVTTQLWGVAAAATAAASAGKGMGAMLGKLGLVGLAGGAGYAVGTGIDQAFGISDKINGVKDYRDPLMMAQRAKNKAAKAEAEAKLVAAGGQVNVTINATGTDPKGVVDIAKREIRASNEAMIRSAQAATGAVP